MIDHVRSFIAIPIYLANIANPFEYPEAEFDDATFLARVHRETGALLLLDIENLRANSINHGVDAKGLIECLPTSSVKALHVSGGTWSGDFFLNDHSHPVGTEVLDLINIVCNYQSPEYITLKRDNRLEHAHEILDDLKRIRS